MPFSEAVWVNDAEVFDEAEAVRVHTWLTGRPQAHEWVTGGWPRETPRTEAVRYSRKSLQAIDASPADRTRLTVAISNLAITNAARPDLWGKFADIHRDTLEQIHGTIYPWFNSHFNTIP